MSVEKLLLHYRKNVLYNNDRLNWIGAEDGSATVTAIRLSSVVAYNVATHKCVRKFGEAYAITDVTNAVIGAPRSAAGNSWSFKFYDIDTDTLLGTVTDALGASGFVDGAVLGTASTGIYIIMEWIGGAGPSGPNEGDTITLSTDTDPGGIAVRLSGESINAGSITWALSATGSTYYAETTADQTMRYGGYKHTPDGTDRLPYTTIASAVAVLGAPFLYAHILDSETYDERDITLGGADYVVQAASGEAPTHTCGIGQRETRNQSRASAFNNATAIFFNENGSDAANGTWQTPKQTPAGALGALAAAGLTDAVYGGTGATVAGGVFTQAIVFPALANATLETEYGYTPMIRSGTAADTINIAAASQEIHGYYLYHLTTTGIVVDFNTFVTEVRDNTIRGAATGILASGATGLYVMQDNIVFGVSSIGIDTTPGANSRIERNIVYNCGGDGIQVTWGVVSINLNDNQVYGNGGIGIDIIGGGAAHAGEILHNLSYGNVGAGFSWTSPGVLATWVIEDNISAGNTGYGYESAGPGGVTLTRCNSYNNTAGAISAGVTHTLFNGNDGADARLVDPTFMDETNSNFGLRRASTITKVAITEIDLGPRLTLMSIENDDITINGLIFNGRNQYNLGIYKEGGGDYEGLAIKYCELCGLRGIAVDDYCNGAVNPTDTVFEGVKVRDNGGGVKFWSGDNTVDGFISYNNIEDNLGTLYNTAISHAVMYGAENGIYVGTTGYGTSIIDTIVNGNSVYGINSIVVVIPTYSCITDAVTSVVDLSAETNFTSNPLFVSVDAGEEDFRIKTTEGGYSIDSDCKGAASDGNDIGAWDIDRDVASWVMRNYEFEFNPNNVREGILDKGLVRWTNGLAALDLYASGFKNMYELRWDAPQVVSDELRLKIKYFTQQIKNRLFATPDEHRVFRLHLEKDDYIDTGTTGVVDAAAKTLTDAAKSFVEYQHQGFHVGIKLESGSGTGTIVDETLTVAPSPSWTTDEHAGRFIYRGYDYYYIMSNTGDALTLSDPDGTLVDAAGIDWAIEEYFKILYTDPDGVMHLEDSDGLLVDGTYEWYIDFMEVVLQRAGINWRQPQFDPDRDYSKTGFQLRLEER